MGEIKTLTISVIILTLIITVIEYLLSMPLLFHAIIAIVIGLVFSFILKHKESKQQIIFSTAILTVFFSSILYLFISIIESTQITTGNFGNILAIIATPELITIPIYFIGLNLPLLIKVKPKNKKSKNSLNKPNTRPPRTTKN
jgi:Na+/H+ antiporter NhaC